MKNNNLSKKMFVYGMEYLNAYYTTLKIDLDSELVQKIWYDVFSNFNDNDFQGIVQGYCKANIYPPQSPTHLLEYAKTLAIRNELTGDEAWELGYSLVKSCQFDVREASKKMEEKGYHAMAQAFLKLSGRFRGLETKDLPYVKKDWKERYEDELNVQVQNNVVQGNLIGSGDSKKLLGENK